jgi:hypothetical protein
MDFSLPKLKEKKYSIKAFMNLYREPLVTYCITPNNKPSESNYLGYYGERGGRGRLNEDSDNDFTSRTIINAIQSTFQKFYLPERVRFNKHGVTIKLSDLICYKIVCVKGVMKFYLTVPKRYAKNFTNAIKSDWGQVDITKVEEEYINIDTKKASAIEVMLKHHYALGIKQDKKNELYPSLASLCSTLKDDEKLIVNFAIEPIDSRWKGKAKKKLDIFKRGGTPSREDGLSFDGIVGKTMDFFNLILDEALTLIDDLVGLDKEDKKKEEKEPFTLNYSKEKIYENSNGYNVNITAVAESESKSKSQHIVKSVGSCFNQLDGDNKFVYKIHKSEKGVKAILNRIEHNKTRPFTNHNIFFEKEMEQIVNIPSKKTLKEFSKLIDQDNFTRTEIEGDFFDSSNDAIPFATTLDKEKRTMYLGGYSRSWWTQDGRYVADKTRLDDRCNPTILIGQMGSGKTSISENQILYTFGCHIEDDEEWKKRSKSVVVFDVADGSMIKNIYNHVPQRRRDRVIVLNHLNINNPIAVNNADLQEYNSEIMKDEDFAYTLAEMEANLVGQILQTDKSINVDRWFVTSLQVAHTVDKDYGYAEAIRILTEPSFRMEVLERLREIPNSRRLVIEIETFNRMATEGNAVNVIINTIQNRFVQLERDAKLWDNIAQKPIRNEDGTVKLNFRKAMDGDEGGAYLILIHIPKGNTLSQNHRRFLFAHYFMKVWNVGLSREVGFKGREYRPETLVVVDEIHQIIDIPCVAKLFIDLFKEPRKYSLRYLFTLHGWSSLSKAGRGIEGDIKESIMDNGANIILLKGGDDTFKSLENFLHPMTLEDFNGLMNEKWCGIFSIRWANRTNVFKAKMIQEADKNFALHGNWDSNDLSTYASPYGRVKAEVREENLARIESMIIDSIQSNTVDVADDKGDVDWENLKEDGTKDRKKRK